MASSFKIGEKFHTKVNDLLNKESISEELREELENLKEQSTVPFKTVRKLHKLLQANGKRTVITDELKSQKYTKRISFFMHLFFLKHIQCIYMSFLRTAHFISQKL